jgi:hypothetical protein
MYRRRFLVAGASAALIAGCTDAGEEAEDIEEELNDEDESDSEDDEDEDDTDEDE